MNDKGAYINEIQRLLIKVDKTLGYVQTGLLVEYAPRKDEYPFYVDVIQACARACKCVDDLRNALGGLKWSLEDK